eukprot:7721513-Pyramimonas_sp.AAC.1
MGRHLIDLIWVAPSKVRRLGRLGTLNRRSSDSMVCTRLSCAMRGRTWRASTRWTAPLSIRGALRGP